MFHQIYHLSNGNCLFGEATLQTISGKLIKPVAEMKTAQRNHNAMRNRGETQNG
jgi:hypothetical protein